MKKLLLVIPLFLSLSITQAQYGNMPIDCLVEAIIQVESRGDSTAIGDRGWAVGVPVSYTHLTLPTILRV